MESITLWVWWGQIHIDIDGQVTSLVQFFWQSCSRLWPLVQGVDHHWMTLQEGLLDVLYGIQWGLGCSESLLRDGVPQSLYNLNFSPLALQPLCHVSQSYRNQWVVVGKVGPLLLKCCIEEGIRREWGYPIFQNVCPHSEQHEHWKYPRHDCAMRTPLHLPRLLPLSSFNWQEPVFQNQPSQMATLRCKKSMGDLFGFGFLPVPQFSSNFYDWATNVFSRRVEQLTHSLIRWPFSLPDQGTKTYLCIASHIVHAACPANKKTKLCLAGLASNIGLVFCFVGRPVFGFPSASGSQI